MSDQPEVQVRLEDRIRLMSAVLAVSDYPDKAQERKPHGTHAHSRATRKFLAEHKNHDAVKALQSILDSGAPLEAPFTLVMMMRWPDMSVEHAPVWMPPRWNEQLRDFYEKSNLAKWWQDENEVWLKSVNESKKMFAKTQFKEFLKPFLGEIPEQLVFVPNISYPTEQEVSVRHGNELVAITPPWLAWGESPPWPFDENVAHIYGAIITLFRGVLLSRLHANADKVADVAKNNDLPLPDHFKATYPSWDAQFTALFIHATTAMYLEDFVSKKEMEAYQLMEKKAHGLTILPGTISVLRRYVQELSSGRYKDIIDFLPIFPKQLRVAKRIVTM